ncbi:probable pectinesterase 53 [Salvia miltiorrhiza]|uniref:probable pectinesterase 53 n=1 Tax=Salvia miltiorrhiza TaxID=226208 RepID=UPI0025AC6A5E|nr:probable pectinesterase 53 [Salvia miltiorrhiza]
MSMALIKLFMLLFLMNCTANSHNTSEENYLNWVRRMSWRNHSISMEATNSVHPCKIIKVHKNPNKGDFTTIKNAIASLPLFNPCRVVISVAPGTYREKIEIPITMAYLTLEGAGRGKTTIRWDDTADHLGPTGQPLGTYGSATFAVNAPHFVAKNITFKNKAAAPAAGAAGKQAVALRISGDMAAFINCKFVGAQDTLYDHKGRHYFNKCHIQGSVDFIFGNGLSLYEGCHLHAKAHTYGALTAQKRGSMLEETGFSFVNCKVTGSGALYLGRAWGTFSRVVFAYTYMDKIIIPRGWNDWGDKDRQMTVFYGQFKCWGPGAGFGGRVKWARELTKQEAQPFLSLTFIDGHQWLTNLL